MENKINLRKILDNNIPQSLKTEGYSFGDIDENWILNAMKEACKQTLELAAENAEISRSDWNHDSQIYETEEVDKQSILNTLKQLEFYERN